MAGSFLGATFFALCLFDQFAGGRQVGAITYLFYAVRSYEERPQDKTLTKRVIAPLIWGGITALKDHPLRLVLLVAGGYFIYTDSKISAIMSRVFDKLKLFVT